MDFIALAIVAIVTGFVGYGIGRNYQVKEALSETAETPAAPADSEAPVKPKAKQVRLKVKVAKPTPEKKAVAAKKKPAKKTAKKATAKKTKRGPGRPRKNS